MDPDRATSRILTALNALGCVLLIAVIIFQWQRELALGRALKAATAEIERTARRASDEESRRKALERDIELLKDSVDAVQQAAEESARQLGEQITTTAALEAELATARGQLAVAAERLAAWETAVQARDERIETLTRDLAATRKRLDEAVARLKQAGR